MFRYSTSLPKYRVVSLCQGIGLYLCFLIFNGIILYHYIEMLISFYRGKFYRDNYQNCFIAHP